MYDGEQEIEWRRRSSREPNPAFLQVSGSQYAFRHPSAPQDDYNAAAASAQVETCETLHEPINRVAKQGRFDWGSFSAFEDGSIEVERAGIRQRFRNFSELKRSLNHRSEDEGSAATGTLRLGS